MLSWILFVYKIDNNVAFQWHMLCVNFICSICLMTSTGGRNPDCKTWGAAWASGQPGTRKAMASRKDQSCLAEDVTGTIWDRCQGNLTRLFKWNVMKQIIFTSGTYATHLYLAYKEGKKYAFSLAYFFWLWIV